MSKRNARVSVGDKSEEQGICQGLFENILWGEDILIFIVEDFHI
jgi:hypothetical protein